MKSIIKGENKRGKFHFSALKPSFIGFLLLMPGLSLAGPVILYTDITSGPNTGGENNNGAYLSIFGKGFGTSKGATDTVTIGGVEVAEYIQWGVPSRVYDSHKIQQISVRIGSAITGVNQPIVVRVNGELSNSNNTFSAVPGATIYYVSTTGNNANDGLSIATAKATPQSTESIMNPGDQTIIMGGTYDIDNDRVIYIREDQGTAENNFAWTGMPGESPLFDRSNGSQRLVHISEGGSPSSKGYVTVSNIRHAGNGAPQISGSGLYSGSRFVNMETWGMRGTGGGSGAWGKFKDDISIFGNSIHDQGCNKLYHNIYVSEGPADNIEIGWNHIYDNADYCGTEGGEAGGRGIQAYDGAGGTVKITNLSIHDNVIHDIGREGITLSFVVASSKVYNNIIYRTGTVTGSGFRSKTGLPNTTEIYNNTFYENDIGNDGNAHVEFSSDNNNPTGYSLKNNIFYSTSSEAYVISTGSPGQNLNDVDASNNLFFGAGATPSWSSNSINENPLLTDPTAPARNFKPQSTSPAKDNGTAVAVPRDFDGVLRPQGSTLDIGAYEFCTTNCTFVDAEPPLAPTGLTVK